MLRLRHQDLYSRLLGGGDAWWLAAGEQPRAAVVESVPPDVLGASDDAALDAQCLGVGAYLEGDSSL